VTSLTGSYVYGDYGSGRIWSLTLSGTGNPINNLLADTSLTISSFGLDGNNELFICAFDGRIYKLNASVIPEFPSAIASAVLLATTLLATIAFKKSRTPPSRGLLRC
jgi:hypothetical protein